MHLIQDVNIPNVKEGYGYKHSTLSIDDLNIKLEFGTLT